MLNQEVEIVLIPKKQIPSNNFEVKSMYGILNKYSNNDLRKFENTAWIEKTRKQYLDGLHLQVASIYDHNSIQAIWYHY